MYTFLQPGEFVQITQEAAGRISGFISRFGDLPSDRGAFLDQFIKEGALNGGELTFNTQTVHGVWFEFRGQLARGAVRTPEEEGYYVLRGTLTQHIEDAEHHTTTRTRDVEFKSFPQESTAAPSKRD